jgi:hypothetical protein
VILCALCGLIFLTLTRSLGSEKVHAIANYQRADFVDDSGAMIAALSNPPVPEIFTKK